VGKINRLYWLWVNGEKFNGGLAQLVERVLSMHEVSGSIPEFSMKHSCTLLPVVNSIEKKCKNQYLLPMANQPSDERERCHHMAEITLC
jgi:hypothetical protein